MRTRLPLLGALLLAALLAAASVPEAARAQIDELDRSRYNRAAYYNYAEPADVTILVNAWGAVRYPGLYELPQGTSMSTLFSLAGGPATGAQERRERRTLTIRLARAQSGGAERAVIFEAEMEDAVYAFESDLTLQDGDVLTAEVYARPRFTWRDALPVVSAAASVASTVLIIQNVLSD